MSPKPKRSNMKIWWDGPYGWPNYEGRQRPVPEHPGVYLWTVKFRNGYLIYAAGLTRGPIRKRLTEHTRKYLRGDYNVLDIVKMRRGVRREIWHGWNWNRKKRYEFKRRKTEIQEAVRKQLGGFRIFVADLGKKKRILERVEATIMNTLCHLQPSPFCDIPDKGMHLSRRWGNEKPIYATNGCDYRLYGLPAIFEI